MSTTSDEKERILESVAETLWLDIILNGYMTIGDTMQCVREKLEERSSPQKPCKP